MPRRNIEDRDDSRHISRRQWLSALGMAGAVTLAGCSGNGETNSDSGSGSDDISQEEIYATAAASSFSTLNPIYNDENGAGNAIARALDLGYTFDEENEYVPLLYDMSTEDGEVWTFKIREGLEFSDPYGEVTASDFVYLIQEVHQSTWASSVASASWDGVTVEETGEYEFQATLNTPQLLWPESFDPQLYPIPQGLLEPYVEEEDAEGLRQDEELLELQFSGNLGPYVLDEWQRDGGTRYSRNDDYYLQDADDLPDVFNEAPYFEKAEIRVIGEQASRLGALETGEVDTASIPPNQVKSYQNNDEIYVNQIPQPYNEKISVNMRDNGWTTGPGNMFRHVPFRQAMAAAIDKQGLIEGVFRDFAETHFTWQPRFSNFYPPESDIPQFGVGDSYGSEVARGLAEDAFEQSEYDYRFDGETMVDPDGNQVQLSLYHSAGQNTEQLMADFIAQELGENLGISVNVEAIDGTRFNNEYWTQTDFPTPETNDDGEVVSVPEELVDTVNGERVEWTQPASTNPGPRNITSNESWDMEVVFGLNTYPRNPLANSVFFEGANPLYNPVGYYPGFDAEQLFENARQATSEEELANALVELFANLAEEQPYIMLAFPDSTVGYREGLEGPIENFSNGWNLPAWRYEG
ncbi:ABC transporter substrate-binding protein [Halorubrum sp. ASP1]|uniref:ABC transporter substrate-binding protein n=1 Tax=Halorubrum tropicale TaxID=1765655 RepID=A0A0M9ARS3_9EURY|nr:MULTISPECIES: ABC transporter substrate-binding protein [Halorubrum]KOX96425.1 ABC transporter substrate-binding protein [Halorubrum tropicale]TKX63662.1 ABC transporter substrate-binding protein [Halorubrum sp. ASP1]